MKQITHYLELCGTADESLLEHRKPLPKEQKEKVLRYLKTGKIWGVRCSLIYDHVEKYQTTASIYGYTDGEYDWSSEEIYHFRKYDMELNPEFIHKVLSRKE